MVWPLAPTIKLTHDDYTVAWICALPIEKTAARNMLDELHITPVQPEHDKNIYTFGRICGHNVVIVCQGDMGTTAASVVVTRMDSSFRNLRFGLLVGIAGGVPEEKDIRLGDVVISKGDGKSGGVVSHDRGKATLTGFEARPFLNGVPEVLRNAFSELESRLMDHDSKIATYLSEATTRNSRFSAFEQPKLLTDNLFESYYSHVNLNDKTCAECGKDYIIDRPHRADPLVHFGIVASGNQVIKNAAERAMIHVAHPGVLAIEMEAAGLMDIFGCAAIRGICDYADSHKNDGWHKYASATAAAIAKEVLGIIPKSVAVVAPWTVQAIKHIVGKEPEEKRLAIINWLTPLNFPAEHIDISSRRQQGTGNWFIKDTRFKTWVDAKYPILFCPGIPGAGKTTIVSTVIDYLRSYPCNHNILVAFAYCSYRRRYEQAPVDIFASILKQVVQSETTIPNTLNRLYDICLDFGTRPTLDEIFEVLVSSIASYNRIFIIVDALDECLYGEAEFGVDTMISKLFQLKNNERLSILVTSRQVPRITNMFNDIPKIEIRANNSDLEMFLLGQMHKLPACVRNSPTLQSTIKIEIIKRGDGMFLLSRLHLESLIDKTTPRQIKYALKNLPQGMEALKDSYSGVMDRILNQRPGFSSLAKCVLTWIIYARRALTTSELLHALAVIPDEDFPDDNFQDIDELLSACAGLVILDRTIDRVRLVHYTAEEYFEGVREHLFPYGHEDISLICLTYLSTRNFGDGPCPDDVSCENRLLEFPFLKYAAFYWNHHVRETSGRKSHEMSARFLQDSPKALSFLQIKYGYMIRNRGSSRRYPHGLNALHIAACLGLLQVSQLLIAQGINTKERDDDGRTPLLWALDGGFDALVQLFLGNERDPEDEDLRGCRAIHYAARKGLLHWVQMFSKAKANINRPDKRKQTPLHYAIMNGCIPVIKFLLAHGADVNALDRKHRSTLHMAVQQRNDTIVTILLSFQANTNLLDSEGDTQLHEAAKIGFQEAVKSLLSAGSEINARNKKKRTPIHLAAMGGHLKIIDILLEYGADLNFFDVNNRTALDWAEENKHIDAVSRLWKPVQGPSTFESGPQKRLLMAAGKGDEIMTTYWLRNGGAINGVDESNSRTAMHYAAMKGRTSLIPTLLDQGSDINLRDKDGSTPVFLAARWWAKNTVSYLIATGESDLSLTDNLGWTILHLVIKRGLKDVACQILKCGGRHDVQDHRGRTPLHVATLEAHLELVELLTNSGASNTIEDLDRWSPSDWATWLGQERLLSPLKVDYDISWRKKLISERIKIGLLKVEHNQIDDECLLHLARCAIFLKAQDLAKTIFIEHGTQNPSWICNCCLKPRKYPTARSFCTVCYDADGCDICFRQKSADFCHPPSMFLRIDFTTKVNKDDRKKWVEELRILAYNCDKVIED